MTTSGPNPPGGAAPAGSEPGGASESPDRPVTTLRGASVDVDPRRALRLVLAVCLVALTLVAIVLLVAGSNKNAQSVSLHDHGVPVSVSVTGCLASWAGVGPTRPAMPARAPTGSTGTDTCGPSRAPRSSIPETSSKG